jgi:uncharacterized protein YggT (Ycf19 family)
MEPYEEDHIETVGPAARPVQPLDSAVPVRPMTAVQPVATAYYSHSERVVRPYNYRPERAIWFVVGLVDSLIAIRFLMRLLGASFDAAFVGFIYGITAPLVAPFRGIFAESGQGTYILEPAAVVAILIYALIGWAVITLIRILSAPRGERPLA